jgi:hypothetical protein
VRIAALIDRFGPRPATTDPPSAALSLGRRRVVLGVTVIVPGVVACA